MSNTTTQFKKQLPRNVCFQILSFVWRVDIGLWLVPYLVHQLGRSAYGLIPMAGIMTQYVSIISESIWFRNDSRFHRRDSLLLE